MQFQPGNQYGRGRVRGSRNRLHSFSCECILAHIKHREGTEDPIPEEFAQTNLWKALTISLKSHKSDYLKTVAGLLPKNVVVESVLTEVDDVELDKIITRLRDEVREEAANVH